MTWPEIILWRRLRTRPAGLKFRRQHPAGSYILDFFCSNAAIAIEVDGSGHEVEIRAERDGHRDRWLLQHGVETIRVSASDVTRDPDGVVGSILSICMDRSDPLHPRFRGGPPPGPGEETNA